VDKAGKTSCRFVPASVECLPQVTESEFKQLAEIEGELDHEHSVLGRREQIYLRKFLFGNHDVRVCAMCGRSLPVKLLVAAHVKRRSDCSRRERLDAKNIVVALCVLGCDALYERGLISVAEGGRIMASPFYTSRAIRMCCNL